jgi:hypothetical protein
LSAAEVAEAAHFLESKKEMLKMDNQFLDIKNVPKVPKLPSSDKAAQTTQ